MCSPTHTKDKFQNLVSSNFSIIEWLSRESNSGFFITNKAVAENLWVSEGLREKLGYDSSEPAPPSLIKEVEEQIQHLYAGSSSNENILTFQNKAGKELKCSFSCKDLSTSLGEGFRLIKLQEVPVATNEKNLDELVQKYQDREIIYTETNELAKVGGWDVDLVNNKVKWTKVTKDIHEVDQDYIPQLNEGINFYREGWSRNKIIKLFTDAVEKGISFDAELKILTAKKNEVWVRTFGKPEFKNGKCVRVYGAFQNIDDKKKIQLEFERTREQYEMIFKNSAVGNILVKTSGKLLEVNPAIFRIFGFEESDREEVMNLTFKDLIHPDFMETAISFRKKLINGEIDTYQLESQFYNKQGEIIWCRTNSSIIRSDDPSETLIITQVEDISEKKELELKAHENSQRFQIAFDYSPIGKGLVSPGDEWQMVNQNLAGMFGYNKEEFKSLNLKDLTHPEDREKDSDLLASLLNREINTYSVEKRFINKSGKTIYGLLSVSAIVDENGKLQYFIKQISDLTKRIVSERALQKSLNELQGLMDATTQISIIQTDLKGYVTKFNKGAENLLGYKAEEVKHVFNVKHLHEEGEVKERAKELTKAYQQEIKGFQVFTHEAKKKKYENREWTYIRKDGTKFPVQLSVTAIRNHNGKINGYLGVATDISNLKEMQTSLRNAKKKAEDANRSKSEFLANMSHEIRTPLNGIIGFTDLLMRSELESSQQKYMQTVYNSANSLMDIINDVLDFSKIEAGKLELNEERTDLIEICDQTIDIIKHQAHKKGLEVLLNIAPSLRRYVYADSVRLRQILTNLLGNSVKFTQEGEIELAISSQTLSDNQDELQFTFVIRDTGIGIAAQNLKRIFSAFDQEDASTTRKYGGSGLGLTISNKLLNLMDSKLDVKSKLNEGSTFSFKIKLKTDKEVTYSAAPPKNISKVLVVDDNDNNRVILRDMLAVNNIEVIECANGIETLNLLSQEQENFDLAIIDYNMPYMNGLSLIEQIRNHLHRDENELPIILLHSSTEDEEIFAGCKELKVHSHMTKPIQIKTLYKMIEAIEKPAVHEEVIEDEITSVLDQKKKFRILIVEDNPVNKFLATSIIKKILPTVDLLQAENGQEAIDIYGSTDLDLIFMDIQMPVMGGFEATRKIRNLSQENSHTPIIALTARAVKDEKQRCIAAGMDDYLPKPIILEDIREMIHKYLVS